jgi:hypothetical protein
MRHMSKADQKVSKNLTAAHVAVLKSGAKVVFTNRANPKGCNAVVEGWPWRSNEPDGEVDMIRLQYRSRSGTSIGNFRIADITVRLDT